MHAIKLDRTRVDVLRLTLAEWDGPYGTRAIARELGISPARVSQIHKDFIESRYLVKVSGPGEYGQFHRGPNLSSEVLSDLMGARGVEMVGMVGGLNSGPNDLPDDIEEGFTPIRVHNIGHQLPIVKIPQNVPWNKEVKPKGVANKVLHVPLSLDPNDDKNIAKVVYRETAKGEPSSVQIWAPDVIVVQPQAWLEFKEWATSRAWRIACWLTKYYGFKYSHDGSMVLPEQCGQFETSIIIPRALAMAGKRRKLTDGIYYFDVYKDYGEIETKAEDEEAAFDLISAARRVRVLEEKMVPTMDELVDASNKNTSAIETLVPLIASILKTNQRHTEAIEKTHEVMAGHADTITSLIDILSPKEPEPQKEPRQLSQYDQVMFG